MDLILASGIFMLALSAVYLVSVTVRKGEAFEYAGAMFFGEFGLLFLVRYIVPSDRGQLIVTIAFGLGMFWTMAVWWKLFRKFQRKTGAKSTS